MTRLASVFSLVAVFLGLVAPTVAADRLQVGITLHPYYSFASAIVGDRADVVPLIPENVNPHGYQPQPEDIKRATELDVLIVNAIGHDEWAFEIIEAAGRADMPLIRANDSVALIPIAGDPGGERVVNPHTFVSTTAAVQQIYEIARRLGEIEPENADFYRANARSYAQKFRQMRAEFMQVLAAAPKDNFRAATMHAGYDYLFQEFGLPIAAVIEPRHGVAPTARQLAQTIDDIRAAGVTVLFAEKYFGGELAETIQKETGVRVYTLSHITDGPYTLDKFETEMRENIDTVVQALKDVAE